MNTMSIAHLVPFANRIGGYERQARLLTRALVERGHRVRIITHAAHAADYIAPDPRIEVVGINPHRGRFDRREILRSIEGVDALHGHALDPLVGEIIAAGRARGIGGLVLVATQGDMSVFREPGRRLEIERNGETAAARAARRWLLRRAISRAWRQLSPTEYFMALNRAMHDEIRDVGGIDEDRIIDLPNAVEIPVEPAPFRPRGARAAFVGRLVERKRAIDLFDALEIVQRECPEASLTIIGDGPERAALERRAARLANVEFAGELLDPVAALRSADLFVFTPTFGEGCPNALLEAAALGLPAIGSNVAGIADWFEHGRNISLVPEREPESIARTWIDLLRDPEWRRSLGAAARRRVIEIASVDRIVSRFESLYREATARRRARLH